MRFDAILMKRNCRASSGANQVTVPAHDPLKVGTLAAILSDVAQNLEVSREELTRMLFD
jgi:hypothetical protein